MIKNEWFGPFVPLVSTPYFTLEKASNLSSTGGDPYYRLREADSVLCCVVDGDDNMILVRQYRPNLEMITTELVAGAVEPGETTLDAARRELAEEAGISCPLLPIGQYYRLMMNRAANRIFIFFGMLPEKIRGDRVLDAEVMRLPRTQLLNHALSGSYQQLTGVGALGLAGALLQVDIWRDPLDIIEKSFRSHRSVVWQRGARD